MFLFSFSLNYVWQSQFKFKYRLSNNEIFIPGMIVIFLEGQKRLVWEIPLREMEIRTRVEIR